MSSIPTDIIKKVKKVELKTRKVVNSVLTGGYHSAFKGRGMEFSEVRAYLPGDDIRSIDWNVTARSGAPFVKIFSEERELTVILVVDISASLRFGTKYAPKNEIVAEIGAMLSFSAINNNDNVGLLLFTDECEKYIPPKKGKKHVLRVIREILFYKPQKKKTRITSAVERLNKTITKKSLVFVLSDFIDDNWKKSLSIVSKKHDLIPIVVNDEMEIDFPSVGLIELYDQESGQNILIDSSSKEFIQYRKDSREKRDNLDKLFRSINVKPIMISSGHSYVEPIIKYFKFRESRMGR